MPVYFGHPSITNFTNTYKVKARLSYPTIVSPKTYMPDIEGKGRVLSIDKEGTVVFEPIGEQPKVSIPFEARNSHFRHPSMFYGDQNKKLSFPCVGDIIEYWCHSYADCQTFCYEKWEKQKPMKQLSLFE